MTKIDVCLLQLANYMRFKWDWTLANAILFSLNICAAYDIWWRG